MSALHLVTNWDDFTDEELMAELAAGNAEALVPLHGRYAALVFNLTAQSLDRPAAEEIVQDVFVAVWSRASTFDPERGQVRPWLLQIAHTRVLNELRRRNRRPRTMPDPDGLQLDNLPDGGPAPDDEAWLSFRRQAVRDAVAALPAAQRQALSLAYFDDLTQAQVAAFLGIPIGTAKTRIRDGLKRLRNPLTALIALALAFTAGLGVLIQQYREERDQRLLKQDALEMVTDSDAQELHLSPAPNEPSNAHGNYRVLPDGGLAVLTIEHLPAPPSGQHYQAWANDGSGWHAIGTVDIDSDGYALLIVKGDTFGAPTSIEVTLETTEHASQPSGPVVLSWSK